MLLCDAILILCADNMIYSTASDCYYTSWFYVGVNVFGMEVYSLTDLVSWISGLAGSGCC